MESLDKTAEDIEDTNRRTNIKYCTGILINRERALNMNISKLKIEIGPQLGTRAR